MNYKMNVGLLLVYLLFSLALAQIDKATGTIINVSLFRHSNPRHRKDCPKTRGCSDLPATNH